MPFEKISKTIQRVLDDNRQKKRVTKTITPSEEKILQRQQEYVRTRKPPAPRSRKDKFGDIEYERTR